ncbi:hypothetical protein IQ259_23375 [Fortiea sp. LEGE XX443]|uniref:hypothetical protein n=1 Tax=Fortiea sp. LEGE XX443 TaxID=1828611 RepID=UPI00187DF624|nr:hypothetical protein [Fortiea sp. LEGE XX443]MBE9007922.1 hypothetical protein [Fortiea sp. LEGE XX443]
MATDYVLFIHGVNTRNPNYADEIFKRLDRSVGDRQRNLKKIALFWGDVNKAAENNLMGQLRRSSCWDDMWFREFREEQIIQFAGDAALYISRHVGAKVVSRLKEQAIANQLHKATSADRLHLVTHSWGTVILFDILFASRWDNPEAPGHKDVMAIRDGIFGVEGKNGDRTQGIPIASIHTLGSPVAIFNLTNVKPGKDTTDSPSSHDITPNLQTLLECLQLVRKGKKLPWRNYLHPGDPIAYPLKELMTDLVDGDTKYLDIRDILTQNTGWLESLTAQTLLPLLSGGDAHGSYWRNDKVVQEIINAVKQESPTSDAVFRPMQV